MYIISFDEEQLVIVEVEDNLEELISTLIKKKELFLIERLTNPTFKFYLN